MPVPDLDPHQIQALRVLDWLYDTRAPGRRTGRSTVLAVHYLRRMVRGDSNRDGWVEIEDHWDGAHSDNMLAQEVIYIGRSLGLQFATRGRSFLRLDCRVLPGTLEALGGEAGNYDPGSFVFNPAPVEREPKPKAKPKPKPKLKRRTVWERLAED